MTTAREIQYVDSDPRASRLASLKCATGLSIARENINLKGVRRFIEGVVISCGAKNSKGVAFRANGMKWIGEVPLILDHDGHVPLGVIRSAAARGNEVVVTAEIMNAAGPHLPHILEAWEQLKRGVSCGVSVGSNPQMVSSDDPDVFTRWDLREVTLTDSPADQGARVTRVFERAGVGYLDGRPSLIEHWREPQ